MGYYEDQVINGSLGAHKLCELRDKIATGTDGDAMDAISELYDRLEWADGIIGWPREGSLEYLVGATLAALKKLLNKDDM